MLNSWIRSLAKPVKKRLQAKPVVADVPFKGWKEGLLSIPRIEALSDKQLMELNDILDWKCFVVDSQGRRFGKPAGAKKRPMPQKFPDYRLAILDERIPLKDLHVLEVGCFEGIHTIGLCTKAGKVSAIDSRINNVVKTTVRAGFFGHHPDVFIFDLEKLNSETAPQLQCDVLHHIGVLYHLAKPVEHLHLLGQFVSKGVLLDTHYATPEMADKTCETALGKFAYRHYSEKGYADVFSGMQDHAKWLLLDDMISILKKGGFSEVEVIEKRAEKNGPRVLLLAKK
jgi:tRNA (mo5U34)-methyltransferase